MKARAILSPDARRELLAAARWIAKDNPAAASALRDAVAKVAERIGKHPGVGSLRTHLADARFRFVALTNFPYIVVYNADRNPPLIVRVVHGARDLHEALKDL